MEDSRYSAPAAGCAAEILLYLARSKSPTSMSAIASGINRTKSLVFRVLKELEMQEFVRECGNGLYWLGISSLELGGSFISQSDYTTTARNVLQQLSRKTGETVSLATLRGTDVIYLEKWEGTYSVVTISHVGQRLPASCTALGKALLAELADETITALYDGELPTLTLHSISSLEGLLQDLYKVRETGYAVEVNEALFGRACLATVVRNQGTESLDRSTTAISISFPIHRYESGLDEFITQIFQARNQLISNLESRQLFEAN